MGISYKITCDTCGAQYPEEIDSETYESSSFFMSSNDIALKIKDNNWFITIDNKVLCPICNVTKDIDAYEVDDNSNAWHRKGVEFGKSGRYEEALQAIDKALKLNPDVFTVWYNKGVALDNLGRYEEALQAYDKAIELSPNVFNVWHRKGVALYKLVRYEEALQAINKALELNPDVSIAWNTKGATLYNLGRHEEAKIAFKKASELDIKAK